MAGNEGERPALRRRGAEIAVALVMLALAAIIAWDSVRIGARWVADGPQTGYFPLYIAMLVGGASVVNLLRALLIPREKNRTFVEVRQLKTVLTVLVPTAVFAAVVIWTGIYAAALAYIAFFMRRLGRYAWWKVAAMSAATVLVLFLMFEIWFLVPLPKGPIERWLGID
ncbi:MAG: hypothetical protein A3D95_09900 [Betaproteobacteria bacterium RIFCSPHIGHO2_12_FULL_69_13]|nr:MAG: hypothetical protein A3D95_09900 [Betaproteobacteria bacterium RIFCSPHIGHO2_12_FULL_69_13]OGA68703.1 MAG: hypothetical protein A3G83_13600 [Betaproteobacteria bacterium RIFCSPLOWO2_12_FULL_68_20]